MQRLFPMRTDLGHILFILIIILVFPMNHRARQALSCDLAPLLDSAMVNDALRGLQIKPLLVRRLRLSVQQRCICRVLLLIDVTTRVASKH